MICGKRIHIFRGKSEDSRRDTKEIKYGCIATQMVLNFLEKTTVKRTRTFESLPIVFDLLTSSTKNALLKKNAKIRYSAFFFEFTGFDNITGIVTS